MGWGAEEHRMARLAMVWESSNPGTYMIKVQKRKLWGQECQRLKGDGGLSVYKSFTESKLRL